MFLRNREGMSGEFGKRGAIERRTLQEGFGRKRRGFLMEKGHLGHSNKSRKDGDMLVVNAGDDQQGRGHIPGPLSLCGVITRSNSVLNARGNNNIGT